MSNIWEQPLPYLANPQGNQIGLLSGAKDFKSKIYLNNISEISFKIYEYENGIRNELYDELEEAQLIEAQGVDWFQINKLNEIKDDVPVAYKEVTCNSLEDELVTKIVYNLNGVFSLYNITEPSKSILHIVTNDISWNIGYVSPSLTSLYRTLSIDSIHTYSLLTGDISKSFNCLFTFNSYYKTINAYTLDEVGKLTDIIIADENILKSWNKSSEKDKILTKLRVLGGMSTSGIQFDIRAVNFGSNFIVNYDYYKPRMSAGLVAALNNRQNTIDTYTSQYNTHINTLKSYQIELIALNNQVTEIESGITAQEGVMNTSLKAHYGYPPSASDIDYSTYQNAVNQLVTLNTQKSNKQTEIDNKNSQIATVNSQLDTISSYIDDSNFFTNEQLIELDSFTFCDEYIDDTFISTSEMTQDKIIELQLQLKANAAQNLARICKPQPEFKATLRNLWSIRDEKDCLISYDSWRSNFKIGNLVTIMQNDSTWSTVRIIGIELDYNDPENAEVIFSTKNRLDDSVYVLGEIQAQASRAYSSVQMNKYAMNEAISNTSSFNEFRTGILNATLNKMVSDDHAQVETGAFGIKVRPWIEGENKYGLNQMWLNPYRMLFTNDGWQTASSAFGLLTFPDGHQDMGINTKYLVGKILLTENLFAENEAGTMSFTKDGLNLSSTVGSDIYSVGLSTSNPSSIFNISVNNIVVFGIDTLNQRLKYTGYIEATGGTLGDLVVQGTLTGGTISGANIISSGNGAGFLSKTVIDEGYITSNLIKIRPMNLTTQDFSPDSSGFLSLGASQIALNNGTQNVFFVNILGEITASTLDVSLINGGMPITYENMYTYLADKYHNHDSTYASISMYNDVVTAINDLTSRVSALEG